MTITALDTHEVVKDLTAAGFTEPQAEAVTRWVRRSQDLDLSDLVTKSDLAASKSDLENSLTTIRSDFQIRLAETKADLLKWMVGTIGLQTVIILGAVVALARLMTH